MKIIKNNPKKGNHLTDESLENASGGISEWDPGWYDEQHYKVNDKEAKQYGIEAGVYRRNELASALSESDKVTDSNILQGLAKQGSAKSMRKVLKQMGMQFE